MGCLDRGPSIRGKEWCVYPSWRGIKRCSRIKEHTRIDDLLAKDQFKNLQPGEVHSVCEKVWGHGTWMHVVVTLSPAGDRVIVASDLSVLDKLFTDKQRWGMECIFSAMNVRGLGLEDTHMTASDRLSRLSFLLYVVLALMVRLGKRRRNWLRRRQTTGGGKPEAPSSTR